MNVFFAIQRWFYKEIFALFYAMLTVGGYVVTFVVMFQHRPNPGGFLTVFFFLCTMAGGIKMLFLFFPPATFVMVDHPILDR